MKKIIVVIVSILIFTVCLSGCKNNNTNNNETKPKVDIENNIVDPIISEPEPDDPRVINPED